MDNHWIEQWAHGWAIEQLHYHTILLAIENNHNVSSWEEMPEFAEAEDKEMDDEFDTDSEDDEQ